MKTILLFFMAILVTSCAVKPRPMRETDGLHLSVHMCEGRSLLIELKNESLINQVFFDTIFDTSSTYTTTPWGIVTYFYFRGRGDFLEIHSNQMYDFPSFEARAKLIRWIHPGEVLSKVVSIDDLVDPDKFNALGGHAVKFKVYVYKTQDLMVYQSFDTEVIPLPASGNLLLINEKIEWKIH